jgi:hypothetical protein
MRQIKPYLTLVIFYAIFIFDYFIITKPENKLESCGFWATVVLFKIWYEIINNNIKNFKKQNQIK